MSVGSHFTLRAPLLSLFPFTTQFKAINPFVTRESWLKSLVCICDINFVTIHEKASELLSQRESIREFTFFLPYSWQILCSFCLWFLRRTSSWKVYIPTLYRLMLEGECRTIIVILVMIVEEEDGQRRWYFSKPFSVGMVIQRLQSSVSTFVALFLQSYRESIFIEGYSVGCFCPLFLLQRKKDIIITQKKKNMTLDPVIRIGNDMSTRMTPKWTMETRIIPSNLETFGQKAGHTNKSNYSMKYRRLLTRCKMEAIKRSEGMEIDCFSHLSYELNGWTTNWKDSSITVEGYM